MLYLRVLVQERRCLLQVELLDAEDKGCERGEARPEQDDGCDEAGGGGRGGVPQRKARSAAACSIATAALPFGSALPLAVVRRDFHREHRDVFAGRQLAPPALIPVREYGSHTA